MDCRVHGAAKSQTGLSDFFTFIPQDREGPVLGSRRPTAASDSSLTFCHFLGICPRLYRLLKNWVCGSLTQPHRAHSTGMRAWHSQG